MAIRSFEIGTTYAGMVNVETLTADPNMSPNSTFLPYSATVQMASGIVVGRGFPLATWSWGYIETDLFAALRVICPGASATVFIRTLKEDFSTYGYYTGRMIWPDLNSYEFRAGKRMPFRVQFDRLVVYTP